jgi:hypothetical protein
MSGKHICEHCGKEVVGICLCNVTFTTYESIPKRSKPVMPVKPTEPPTKMKMPSLDDLYFSMECRLTDEQAKQFKDLFKFDIAQFVGASCIICGQVFTQAYFDNGGTITRNGKNWVHDTCLPSAN